MTTLLILIVGYLVLTPLEVVLGGRAGRSRRANLGMILPTMLTAGLVGAATTGVALWGNDHDIGLLPWLGLAGPLAVVVAFLVFDLEAYVDHRFRHRFGLLWRFHRAHHTDTEVDVTTSLRNHPLDVATLVLLSGAVTLAVGAEAEVVAAFGVVTAAFGIWDHVRVALPTPVEHAIARVFQTPGMHRVHHSPHRHQTDSNYGLVLSVWDHAFGTFSTPDPRCEAGLDTADLADRQSVRAMLADPWRPSVPLSPAEPLTPVGRRDDLAVAAS
jgi:sterol desaturase/sphingolipid hydroxylase (fatty acid hydroxylase superfamily)